MQGPEPRVSDRIYPKRALLARLATSRAHEFITERSELLDLEILEAAKRATKDFFQSLGDSPLEENHRALISQFPRLTIRRGRSVTRTYQTPS